MNNTFIYHLHVILSLYLHRYSYYYRPLSTTTTTTTTIAMSGSASSAELDRLRSEAASLIASAGTHPLPSLADRYNAVCLSFLEQGGEPSDMIIKIGESMFNLFVKGGSNDRSSQGPAPDDPLPGSITLDFDYLEKFMYDCFKAVGVPEKEAKVSANVLIEADKRGIDSHGVGRLKVKCRLPYILD